MNKKTLNKLNTPKFVQENIMALARPCQSIVYSLVGICNVQMTDGCWEEAILVPGGHGFQTPMPFSSCEV